MHPPKSRSAPNPSAVQGIEALGVLLVNDRALDLQGRSQFPGLLGQVVFEDEELLDLLGAGGARWTGGTGGKGAAFTPDTARGGYDYCVVGALIAAGPAGFSFSKVMGFVAVTLASVNIFGGFIVTQRMLQMFKKKK